MAAASSVRTFGRAVCLVALSALAVPTAAMAAHHEDGPAKAWDQAAVADLFDKLARETHHLQDGLGRHLEESPEGSPRRIVLHDVYAIHHRAISLLSGVRSGLSRDQTEPVFRRLMDGVRNARRDAQAFPEIEKLRGNIDAANGVLQQLEAYYGVHE